MKIFQLIQKSQLRGAEIFACQLSTELNNRGHDCIVITLFQGESKLPFEGRIIHLGLSKKNRFLDWSGWRKLAHLVEKEKPDVLQANAGDTLKYAIISKLIFRWSALVVFRNASTVSLYIKNSFVKQWNYLLYSFTDHVISVSQYTRGDFINTFPDIANRVSVVPIGIPDQNLLEERTNNGDACILLHVGGFTFEKNHAGLIKIVSEVIRKHTNAVLWLVGDGPLRTETENLVKSMHLTERVKFWGYQSNPQEFFRQASVFLLPSVIEGLPAVILESFYHKVPVVAYRVGGIGELVRNGETGFLIEKGNEKDFAYATLKALQGGADVSGYIENAHHVVLESYTLQKIASRFEAIYTGLLRKKG